MEKSTWGSQKDKTEAITINSVLISCSITKFRFSDAITGFLLRTALCFIIHSIRHGNALPFVPTHGLFLKVFFSKLQQPASLEVWTIPSCAANLEVSVMARTLTGMNLSAAYHGALEGRNFYCYVQRMILGKSPCNTPRYVWVDVCSRSQLAGELETFLYFCSNTNFILSTTSQVKLISAHQIFLAPFS